MLDREPKLGKCCSMLVFILVSYRAQCSYYIDPIKQIIPMFYFDTCRKLKTIIKIAHVHVYFLFTFAILLSVWVVLIHIQFLQGSRELRLIQLA